MDTCTHGLRGEADAHCVRCSTISGVGPHFQSGRVDVAGRQWTRTRRTATTMGLTARMAWTAVVVFPGLLGLDLLWANGVIFYVLGPFWSIVIGAVLVPDVWARGRQL